MLEIKTGLIMFNLCGVRTARISCTALVNPQGWWQSQAQACGLQAELSYTSTVLPPTPTSPPIRVSARGIAVSLQLSSFQYLF